MQPYKIAIERKSIFLTGARTQSRSKKSINPVSCHRAIIVPFIPADGKTITHTAQQAKNTAVVIRRIDFIINNALLYMYNGLSVFLWWT